MLFVVLVSSLLWCHSSLVWSWSSSYNGFASTPPSIRHTLPLVTSLKIRQPLVVTSSKNDDESSSNPEQEEEKEKADSPPAKRTNRYELGVGKNLPLTAASSHEEKDDNVDGASNWMAPQPVAKPDPAPKTAYNVGDKEATKVSKPIRTKRVVSKNEEVSMLKGALWHEEHFSNSENGKDSVEEPDAKKQQQELDAADGVPSSTTMRFPKPSVMYPDIDLSIPETVYSQGNGVDIVWDTLRYEAQREAQREPLLVSFLHSTILNHNSLESALAFHLANKLASPAMISTQIQSLVLEAFSQEYDFGRSLRADMMAVRDRDPACTCLPDVFLYFKGFHALQTHRVGHYMYCSGRKVLASFLQSQMSQNFQIDIHPNATMGRGIMLDHGTGIVVGETARVGHNCSILHHVTLGGSGKQGVDRHPKVGDGVLLGAGVSVLGNVLIGDGCQVGAGTLVISDLPPHSVAVGVPARIIGSFVDVTVQPSLGMNQMMGSRDFDRNVVFESEGI